MLDYRVTSACRVTDSAERDAWTLPTLISLCCRALVRSKQCVPDVVVSTMPARVRAMLLHFAVSQGSFQVFDYMTCALSSGVTEIRLHGSGVNDFGIGMLSRSCGQYLIRVNLSHCTHLRDAGVVGLVRQCPQLRALDLSHCRLTDTAFTSAARCCCELRELDCSWNGSGVGERSMYAIASCCLRLESLALCGCQLRDDVLVTLAKSCTRLSHLHIRGCGLLTEPGFVTALCSLSHICNLELCAFPHISEPSLQVPPFTCLCAAPCTHTDVAITHSPMLCKRLQSS